MKEYLTGRALRIAILLPSLAAGGAEHVALMLAREFMAVGHEVELILVQADGALMGEVPAGVKVVDLGCTRFRYAVFPLVSRLRRNPPDVLLASMWPLTGIAAVANRIAGGRSTVVTSEHNDLRLTPAVTTADRRLLRLLGRRIYGLARAQVVVSRGLVECMGEIADIPPDRLTVIYNPLRPISDAPLPDDPLTRWWRGGGAALIGVGSLKPAKGFDLLIDAVALLRGSGCDPRLLILGEGPERAALEARIEGLGLHDHVRLAGFRADPYPYMRAADLFVLSSRWEGLGNVIAEALACGTNVVSTDCPSGPAELLEHGRYGRLVPPGDPQALADGIRAALAQPLDPGPLIARAAEFTPARAAAAYLDAMGLAPAHH